MLELKFACQAYYWTKPIMDGSIRAEGIEIDAEASFPAQTFARLIGNAEFDVAELGLTYYIGTLESDDPPFVSIPVFPVRLFRLSSVYVRAGGAIEVPQDLIGKRYGEFYTYGHDAGVWVRGILRDHHDVPMDSHAAFFIGGVGQPMAELDWLPYRWPAGARAEHIGPDRTLDSMLIAGEIDVLLSAVEPPALNDGSGTIRRLFEDAEFVERDYFKKQGIHFVLVIVKFAFVSNAIRVGRNKAVHRCFLVCFQHATRPDGRAKWIPYFKKTGVFPIMHTVAIRTEIHRDNPWVARSLYDAFEQARAKVQERESVREYVPFTRMIPLYPEHQREILDLMGKDYWPYGLEPNRKTLDAFLGYHHDLGLSRRRFEPEDLFLPERIG